MPECSPLNSPQNLQICGAMYDVHACFSLKIIVLRVKAAAEAYTQNNSIMFQFRIGFSHSIASHVRYESIAHRLY